MEKRSFRLVYTKSIVFTVQSETLIDIVPISSLIVMVKDNRHVYPYIGTRISITQKFLSFSPCILNKTTVLEKLHEYFSDDTEIYHTEY